MRLNNCFRLARQSLPTPATPSRASTRRAQDAAWTCHACARRSHQAIAGPRMFATGTGASDDPHVSTYKKRRVEELRKDRESEAPLYPETYPRLVSDPKRVPVPEFLENFHERLPDEAVTLSGRVRAKRAAGKSLLFLDIVNEFERVQVMVNKKNLQFWKNEPDDKFSLFRTMIEVGDHISVTGVPMRTKAGEATLSAQKLPELLSPSMEQVPEKLTDPKARMHDRHVDMLVNREVVDVLRLRAEITKHMRDYLHSKRFLEFQTPILAEKAGGALARPFVTRATEFRDKDLALRVAPELWLKRLVVGGVDKVFEIGPAFRNEGVDATHNPEFTMCEFYSAYTNLSELIKETEELIYSLASHCQDVISTQTTALPPLDMSRFVRPFKQIEFLPGLEAAMGIRFPKLSAPDPFSEVVAVLKLAGIQIPGGVPESLSKLLDRLAAVYLEPMSAGEPVFITHHPAIMSPLAKSFLCPQTYQLVSARAELFMGGRELANMYEEENDPEEQKRKMSSHRRLINQADGSLGLEPEPEPKLDVDEAQAEVEPQEKEKEPEELADWLADYDLEEIDLQEFDAEEEAALDQSYVKALDHGLPPTGGWGCGVERLVMLFSGANRISDCLSFGTLRNVVGLSAEEERKNRKVKTAASEDESSF